VNIESEYDYGSRSGVWRLFRLFNKYNYKYTLYAVGKAIEDNPAVGISSVKKGHDVASHAYRCELLGDKTLLIQTSFMRIFLSWEVVSPETFLIGQLLNPSLSRD
jgi:peptidoglycan/xylan/chitin deacetylase (PgdA/CDA1 family)